MDFFNRLFGTSVSPVVSFIMVFIVALVIIGMAFWLYSFIRTRGMGIGLGGRGRQPRLAVLDYTDVDNRRRLVLIRRDNVEHLLLIGGATEIVVEQNIVRGVPVTTLRDPMPYREPLAEPPPPPVPVDLSEPATEREERLSPRDQARRAAGQMRTPMRSPDPFFETPSTAPDIRVQDEAPAAPAAVIPPPVISAPLTPAPFAPSAPRPLPPAPKREPAVAPRQETQRQETQRPETQRYEAPKIELPKAEPLRASPLRAEPARVEPPRMEPPKPLESLPAEPPKPAPVLHEAVIAEAVQPKPQSVGDTLAQRLEQAMRRPLSTRPQPQAEPRLPIRGEPAAAPQGGAAKPMVEVDAPLRAPEVRSPTMADESVKPRTSAMPKAEPAPESRPSQLTQQEKMVFDSLEEEMASLLGRAPKKGE